MELMMTAPNSRNSMALALRWTNQITSIALELVLPIAGGFWLDRHYGTNPWWMIAGVLLGCLLGTQGMIRLVRDLDK